MVRILIRDKEKNDNFFFRLRGRKQSRDRTSSFSRRENYTMRSTLVSLVNVSFGLMNTYEQDECEKSLSAVLLKTVN